LHACFQLFLQQATTTPLCLLVEDGHWLDPSSQELLDMLVASLARRPLLVLCTARPGFRHTWADYTYFHRITVEPLTAAETMTLVRDILHPYDASAAMHALIRDRTGGNPFFVEECVQALQSHALLTRQGQVYEMATEAHVTLPVSIQGIVQARLDRLPVEEKHLVQVAAVIGPEIALPLLQAAIEQPEEELNRYLKHLQVACASFAALVWWLLGYPQQALRRSQEAITLASELAPSFAATLPPVLTAMLHHYRRDVPAVYQWADSALSLATEQGFALWAAVGTLFRGWALAVQG
jgi:predicted ATPase